MANGNIRDDYKITYQAADAANVVVASTRAVLHKIIIGADVSTSTIEISDSATDGDGNVKILLTGNSLMTATGGEVTVNAVFTNGITADLTNQTNVTFIWK